MGLSLLTLCLLCAHTAQAQSGYPGSGYPGSGSGGSGSGGSYGIWQVTHTASGVDKFDLFDPQGHHSHDEQPWPDHITGVWRRDTTLTASSPFDDALFTWHASGGSPSPYDLSNNLGILSRFLSSISLDMGLYPTSQGLPMTTTVGVKVTSQRDTGPRPGRPL